MARVVLDEIDLGSVEDAVGARTYAAALRSVEDGAVRRVEWEAAKRALHGVVQDRGGEYHETVIYFTDGCPMMLVRSYCSCSGYECKHAAALTLAGALSSGQDIVTRPPSVLWEQSLAALLESRRGGDDRHPAQTPIAIELSLSDASPPRLAHLPPSERALQLHARVVQPGKKSAWVGSSLTWGKLSPRVSYGGYGEPAYGEYSAQHLRLLRELYWTHHSSAERSGYYSYYSGTERQLDLAAFESRQLWALLDEAYSIGLPVVYRGSLGPVPKYDTAELCLDFTRRDPSGPLQISPQLRVQDVAVTPLLFIGSECHGLIYAARSEIEQQPDPASWRFRLARLTPSAPAQLMQMATTGQQLKVPAAEESKFREQYYPRLRHAATLTSSDDSVSLPEIPAPTLVLGASYGQDHDLDVMWEWRYQVGDQQLSTPVAPRPGWAGGPPAAGPGTDEAGYRDFEAEQGILAELDLPPDRFRPARMTGLDTMRFSTEVLPLVADQPGVAVEISGEPANYREVGDSLRINFAAEAVAGDNDWLDLGVTITVDGGSVSFGELFRALSLREPYLLLDNGAYFSLDKPELQALARLIREARALQDLPATGPLRLSRFQAGLWGELAELGVVRSQATAWQRQVDGLLSGGGLDTAEIPTTLTGQLRPYQIDGFYWLAFLWQHKLGGILADDMGLGKTLQSLALISHARQQEPDGPPFLVVSPTSVISNWAAEAARFTPQLSVVVISDTVARRGRSLQEITAGADVVVTTYTLLRIDFASYSARPWAGLILDEAQYVKNHKSKIYQCARRMTAPVKLAITGTPMENNLMELWSLLSITAPGLFPNPDRFGEYYARPIEKMGKTELLGQLRRRVKPLMMRRTKEQVAADLPAKQEQVLEVELHPRHRKLYQMHLQRERQKVLGLIGDLDANRFTILRSLTLLRQLSLHAGLVDPEHDDLPCSKIEALLDLLDEVIGGGHRALVFSQFTRFLERVRQRLDEAGIRYCYLDGRTRDRQLVLQRFKTGEFPVFMISLKAGGFGLNLTEADYCFLLDPWWNPATEAQAVDRTHRIGQTRNVVVYRLISGGTIEEKVMALKARKAELFASVIDSGNVFAGGLDADDIRGLFD
jgi:superfamily II DNA or RNA helicase